MSPIHATVKRHIFQIKRLPFHQELCVTSMNRKTCAATDANCIKRIHCYHEMPISDNVHTHLKIVVVGKLCSLIWMSYATAKYMLPIRCFALFFIPLLAMINVQSSNDFERTVVVNRSISELKFPSIYHVYGTIRIPSASINEPFQAWYVFE